MIKLKHIYKYYNQDQNISLALKDINLEFSKNEIVAITGSSGSGKTTLLNVICSYDSYEDGTLEIDGVDFANLTQEEKANYRKNHVGFIFQQYNLIESYTVYQNVRIVLEFTNYAKEKIHERCLELIEKVGLKERINNKATKLSGGEKQRCVIARALAMDVDILACDEPTGNLDSKTSQTIIELIKDIAKDKLVFIVTHDFEQFSHIVTRHVEIKDGEINLDHHVRHEEDNKKVLSNKNVKTKVPLSLLSKIALRNALSTPKKLIFTMLVFLFLVVQFSTSLLSIAIAESNYYDNIYPYNYFKEKRIIVYDKDNQALDKNKLEAIKGVDTIYYNPFMIDNNLSCYGGSGSNGFFDAFAQLDIVNEFANKKISVGRRFEHDQEIVIVINNTPNLYDNDRYLNEIITTNDGDKLLIVGIIYHLDSNNANHSIDFIISGTKNLYQRLASKIDIYRTNISAKNAEINYQLNSAAVENFIQTSEESREDFALYIGNNYKFFLDLSKFTIINSDQNIISITDDYMKQLIDETAYEASVIVKKQSDASKVIKEISKLGYMAVQSTDFAVKNADAKFLITIMNIIMGVVAGVQFIIYFLIGYVILLFILTSKKKDYALINTLGLSTKQTKNLITVEFITISTVSFLVVFVFSQFSRNMPGTAGVILKLLFKDYLEFNFVNIIKIFVLITFMALLISRKYGKKMVKSSIVSNMRKEGYRD